MVDNFDFTKEYVCIDIETTGLQLHYDRIIEIGALRIENNKITGIFQEYVNPRRSWLFKPGVTQINGISEATVRNADTIDKVLPRFMAFVGDSVVIAHNAKFDLDFINAELYDNYAAKSFSNKYIDTLEVSRICFPKAPNHKLSTLVSYLKLSAKNAHNSVDDCKCVYELVNKIFSILLKDGKGINNFVETSNYSTARERAVKDGEYIRSQMNGTTVFTEIHKRSVKIYSQQDLGKMASEMHPQKYEKALFLKPEPARDDIKRILELEANSQIKAVLFKQKKIDKYISDNIDSEYETAYNRWSLEKEAFDKEQEKIREQEDRKSEQVVREKIKQIAEQCDANNEYIISNIDRALGCKNFPYHIETTYEIDIDNGIVDIKASLPSIEQIPIEKYEYGSIIGKKKTQKDIKFDFVQCAFSIALYIASCVLGITPKIKQVFVSEFDRRRNKDGDLKDVFVLSVKFLRGMMEGIDIPNVRPQEFCMQFENRCNITTTGIMKAVKPFEREIKI